MPHIIKRECDAVGRPLIEVGISPENTNTKEAVASFMALIDTGATGTSVSRKVMEQCRLTPLGRARPILTAGGEIMPPIVDFSLFLVSPGGGEDDSNIRAVDVEGYVNTLPESVPFDVILGRNILCLGEFRLLHCRGFEFSLE